MPNRTLITAALAIALAVPGLAGCLGQQPGSEDESEFSVARVFTIHVDRETSERMNGADSPAEAIDRLVDTSLVVRVGAPGAYTLTYTDEDGDEKTETLVDLAPGRPHQVAGVDALTFATLKDATGKVVAARKAVSADWWKAGEVPLGVVADAPSRTVYDYRFDSAMSLTLRDVESEDGNGRLDSLTATLSLPIDGELSWDLRDDGLEDRLDLAGEFRVDDSRGSLVLVEASGSVEGKSASGGVEVASGGASAEGAATLWLRDGKLSAGQFQGGSFKLAPQVYVWAEGEAFQGEEFECAGASRADRCQPESIDPVDETSGPEAKESFDDSDFRVPDDEEAQDALRFFERLLEQDLQVHDQLTFTAFSDGRDFGAPEANASVRFSYELLVPDEERVTVPAGAFEALKITQVVRFTANVDAYSREECVSWGETGATTTNDGYDYGNSTTHSPTTPQPSYPSSRPAHPYGCTQYETRQILRDLHVDETLASTTVWLDADTFQPLKVVVDSPLDVGEFVREIIRAADRDFWEGMPLRAFEEDQIQLTATGTSEVVAREITGNARFSPYVGLFLASSLTGVMNGALGGPFGGFPTPYPQPGYGYAEPAYPSPTPPPDYHEMRSLSLYPEGPVSDGAVSYAVGHASSRMAWYDVQVMVNGEPWKPVPECPPATDGAYALCRGDATIEGYEQVMAGDSIRLRGVSEGDSLMLVDVPSNTVMYAATI